MATDIKTMNPEEKFFHRDLSWLSFNERVLEEAADSQNPLLERLRFLAIFVNNLDEFLMVRMAKVKRLLASGHNKKDNWGYYPQDLFSEMRAKVSVLSKRLYTIYHAKIQKEKEQNKIFIKKHADLNEQQKKYVKRYFETTIFPIATPMAIDQGRPFPVLPFKTLAFAVSLSRYSEAKLAIIPIPKAVPRLLKLPSPENDFSFILIEETIRENLEAFFKGWKISGSCLFRVIRDSELSVAEEYSADLLHTIESELKKRPWAKPVYAEVEKSASGETMSLLCQAIDFSKDELTVIDGDMDLTYLFELIPQVSIPQLCYHTFTPAKSEYENIFDKIKDGDFLLHLPYQSFQPTVDLIQSAAKDANVLAIKMTLYRTGEDSSIIKALKEAAKNKKQVTVLVEIRARFEEEKNIGWVRELEEAGCHVMYGLAGMKVHSKITLIVRKEENQIKRYVHLSTGNYNERTARIYTDVGYFTANDDFARDISDAFNVITGYSVPSRWKRVVSSPNDLRQYFFELADKEIEHQKKNKNGLIFAKMNSLEDTRVIEKLYEASAAGVKVKLIVRGICCLIPGVSGLSENIEVKSIVGRFLEHSRIYIFNNNADHRIFLSSADWMTRNLDHRIELLFEIYKDDLKEQLLFIMDNYWKDNLNSWILLNDKNYIKQKPQTDGQEKLNIQEYLIKYYTS